SAYFLLVPLPSVPTLLPYTTLFRSAVVVRVRANERLARRVTHLQGEGDSPANQRAVRFSKVGDHVVDGLALPLELVLKGQLARQDRKSTRLNSSHQIISYAVFCLKK